MSAMDTSKSSFVIRVIDAVWRTSRFPLARYLIAGVTVSVGYTVTIVALVSWLGWVRPEAANVISLILWTIVSYFVHRDFTFRYKVGYRDSLPRFIFVFTLKLIASVFVIAWITKYAAASYLIGVIVNWLVLPMVSYVALKLWVFQQHLPEGAFSVTPIVTTRLFINNIIQYLQKLKLFTTRKRILCILLLVAVYLAFELTLELIQISPSYTTYDTASYLQFSPYRQPMYGMWANNIYLLSGSWRTVVALQLVAFVSFAAWIVVELALISNLGVLSAIIFVTSMLAFTRHGLFNLVGSLLSEGLFYPMIMLTAAMFLAWVRTWRTSFLIGLVLIIVGMTQVRSDTLLLPAVPVFAAICVLTAQAERRSANARSAVFTLFTVVIGFVFMPPLLGKSVMQISTTEDPLGLVVLPRVSLLPLSPVLGERSPEWTAMSSSWRAAAAQLDITGLTQFDGLLQETIRWDLAPNILLPAILNRSPKDVEEEYWSGVSCFDQVWRRSVPTICHSDRAKHIALDAKHIALQWIIDEWPSYIRLSGMHLWGILTMANLMDNGEREQVWKALNAVSILTWRYAPFYTRLPFVSKYLSQIPERLKWSANAFNILIRWASIAVLIIGIVSAISLLIRVRTNREIPRGIVAIAFAVGWSIVHSIPGALFVYPDGRYMFANILMMLSGGAAWFAYLGTNEIARK